MDISNGERNRSLVQSALKNVAAFLNTDGGTLLIGVSDISEIKGLDRVSDTATATIETASSKNSAVCLTTASILSRMATQLSSSRTYQREPSAVWMSSPEKA